MPETPSTRRWSSTDRTVGRWSCYTVFVTALVYVPVLLAGMITAGPGAPLVDPYVAIMELLIFISSVAMVVAFVALHLYTRPAKMILSGSALIMIALAAGITLCVHGVLLAVGRRADVSSLPGFDLLFSWTWPSVVYALDVVAWDFFFGLAALLAAAVLHGWMARLMALSGVLALGGIGGAVIGDMNVRNIGIVGYAVVFPVAVLLLGRLFAATPLHPAETFPEFAETFPEPAETLPELVEGPSS